MIIKSLILGIVQGATEFLPVSSSAHLVIFQKILGLNLSGAETVAFGVALHLGTALAIIVALWSDITSILKSLISGDDIECLGSGRKISFYIIIATLPVVFVALPFKEKIEQMFVSPMIAGYALIVTGLILFLTKYAKIISDSNEKKWWQVILVGCAQAIAIIPGISRSGSTISMGIFLKWDRKFAAKFSFLMFLIAVIGAAILELPHLVGANISITSLVIGFVSSFVVGFVCVKWMMSLVSNARLWLFAPYCVTVGILTIIILK